MIRYGNRLPRRPGQVTLALLILLAFAVFFASARLLGF
jgi:hypothetical protein